MDLVTTVVCLCRAHQLIARPTVNMSKLHKNNQAGTPLCGRTLSWSAGTTTIASRWSSFENNIPMERKQYLEILSADRSLNMASFAFRER